MAIKIISKFQAPGDYLKKFLPREIEVVKGLKHENLIRFLQAIETTHRSVGTLAIKKEGLTKVVLRNDILIPSVPSRHKPRTIGKYICRCGKYHSDI